VVQSEGHADKALRASLPQVELANFEGSGATRPFHCFNGDYPGLDRQA